MLCPMVLAGCGSFRLYSEIRDKQGAEAKEAWAKVDLNATVATERANLTKLLDLELETQDQLAVGIRDHQLRAIVEGGKLGDDLVKPTDDLLKKLIGAPEQFATAETSLGAIRTNSRALDTARDNFRGLGIGAPTCSDVAGGQMSSTLAAAVNGLAPNKQTAARLFVTELDSACQKVSVDALSVYATLGGQMSAALTQYKEDAAALVSIRNSATAQKKAYEVARAEYDKAVAEYQHDPTLLAKVQEKANAVREAAASLAGFQDAFSIQLLSEGRLKSIDAFFKTVASTDPAAELPQGTNSAAVALALLPDLVDSSRVGLADATKPLTFPLLLRRNYEQLRLESANREIAARETMTQLSRDLIDALYLEAHQVWMASKALNEDEIKKHHGKSVLTAFASGNADEKEHLYDGAARYLDAVNRLDARRYKLQYMRLAASHELSLAYAEVNMKQWQALVGTTVDQLAAYGAGGIKAADITNLLNAAGIVWIGVGVNK